MKICENGIARLSVYVPAKPTPAEMHAAKELAKYLKKMSGASFRIVRGIPNAGPALIVADIDHTPLARARTMAAESVLRVMDGDRLFLLGGDPRGTLTGVYAFLRDELRCVFPQPNSSDEYVPKKATIEIAPKDYYHEPFLPWRYIIGGGGMNTIDWAAKAGMSCGGVPCDGSVELDWQGEKPLLPEDQAEWWAHETVTLRGEPGIWIVGHAAAMIMPPSKYFDTHPEYFAYNPNQSSNAIRTVVNGRDSFGICWTHPEVNRIYKDYFLDFFARHPYVTRFTFFPNDGQPHCWCDNCRKVEEPWKGKTTNDLQYTRNYLLFTSRIAEAVAEKFPHVRIEVGSYSSHTELPDNYDQDLPENLDVLFCIFERKWDRALDDPPSDKELRETLPMALISSYEKDALKYTKYHELFAKWRKRMKGELHYYDYLTSTFASCGMLFPVSRSSCRTIRYLKEQGFTGYGTQWFNVPLMWASYGLSMYVTARTMWDGDAQWEHLAREYCRGFFEDAAGPMFRFFKTLEDSAHHVRFGMGIPEILQIFDQQTYDTCRQLLRDAISAKVPAKVKRRIRDQQTLLEFGHLFWLTRQVEMKIEEALENGRLDDTFSLLGEHLKIDDRIQRLFNHPLLRWGKGGNGVIYRHIMGHLADNRGILHVVKLMKEATNKKNRDMWYDPNAKL
ncbi:MAG: DUF4838 domain-containing protein [Armatimonadota bacterium]|nr:DUF4838 domain-containing protein [Armatimonadota bacterium]